MHNRLLMKMHQGRENLPHKESRFRLGQPLIVGNVVLQFTALHSRKKGEKRIKNQELKTVQTFFQNTYSSKTRMTCVTSSKTSTSWMMFSWGASPLTMAISSSMSSVFWPKRAERDLRINLAATSCFVLWPLSLLETLFFTHRFTTANLPLWRKRGKKKKRIN